MECGLLSVSVTYTASRGFAVQKLANSAEASEVLLGLKTLGTSEHCIRQETRSPNGGGGRFDAAFTKLLWQLIID